MNVSILLVLQLINEKFIKEYKILILMMILLASCSNDSTQQDNQMETYNNFQTARVVQSFDELPQASKANGSLYYVIEKKQFYYSNGKEWVVIDLSGPQGINGKDGSAVQVISENTVYTKANSPYLIKGPIVVEEGKTLTIRLVYNSFCTNRQSCPAVL